MSTDLNQKLVVTIASSAVLTLDEARDAFREHGLEAYRKYQRENQDRVLPKGPAFAFVKRLLAFNLRFPEEHPIEVILISHNDCDTGLRIMKSLAHYELSGPNGITRAAFVTDANPADFLRAYNSSLFLSKRAPDAKNAIDSGFAAGTVLPSALNDDEDDDSLRIAFDFDGVLADSSSDRVYTAGGGLEAFNRNEIEHAKDPCQDGPLASLLKKLGHLRDLEFELQTKEPDYRRRLSLSIITARGIPGLERVVSTLRNWEVTIDRSFFLDGLDKGRILATLRPHIFFDDNLSPNLETAKDFTPCVHVPFSRKFSS